MNLRVMEWRLPSVCSKRIQDVADADDLLKKSLLGVKRRMTLVLAPRIFAMLQCALRGSVEREGQDHISTSNMATRQTTLPCPHHSSPD
jgi:hypothetical protein